MPIKPIRYPLDLTGTSRDNLVLNEIHKLKSTRTRAVALQNGAFFTASVVVRDVATGRVLTASQDYEFDNLYQMASEHAKAEVAAIIVITNTQVSDTISVDYQCIGGLYGYSTTAIMQQIEDLNLDNRRVEWGNIYNKPAVYPPAKHLHDIGDVYGFEYLVQAIQQLRHAIMLGDEGAHENIYKYIDRTIGNSGEKLRELEDLLKRHIADKNNPHEVTAGKIGVYTKKEIDDRFGEVIKNGKLVPDAVPLSRVEGNMITMQDDGIYYGVIPPERFANVYVDPDIGVDEEITRFNGRGTRNKPLRTLAYALAQGPAMVTRRIWLAEGKRHPIGKKLTYYREPTLADKQSGSKDWYRAEGETGVLRGGVIYLAPYGSHIDNVSIPINQERWHNPDVHTVPTTLVLDGMEPSFRDRNPSSTDMSISIATYAFLAQYPTTLDINGIVIDSNHRWNADFKAAYRSPKFVQALNGVLLHPWVEALDLRMNNIRVKSENMLFQDHTGANRRLYVFNFDDDANKHKVTINRQHGRDPNLDGQKMFMITNPNVALFVSDFKSTDDDYRRWIRDNVDDIRTSNGRYTNMSSNITPWTISPVFENGVLRMRGHDDSGNWVDKQIWPAQWAS